MDEFGMARGSMLRIEDGVGVQVRVLEGEVWLTQDGCPRDHMLLAGQSFRIDRPGLTIAQAFKPSLVGLSSPVPGVPARKFLSVVLPQRRAAAG
jgi:hypothetical protein